jgi:nickel-dependent lactate racemase
MWKDVKVDRWEGQIEIQVPKSALILESVGKEEQGYDPVAKIKDALKNPLGMEAIKGLVNRESRVAITFDNPIKPCPSFFTIPVILNELREVGVRDENIVLVSANGCQRKHRPSEFIDYRNRGYGLPPGRGSIAVPKEIFHEFWPHRFIRHDSANPEGLVNMGYSKLGDVVEVNKVLQDYDLVVYTGAVYPMAWGGYGGIGVVIGLSSAKSIASHHNVGVIGHKDSCHADQERNFYRKHKDAIMERIEEYTGRKVFYIDGVLNGARQWTHFSAGHFREIQEPIWKAADQDRIYEVEQADVVVVGLPKWALYDTTRNPMICLNAAANILRNSLGKPILREGGVIILIAVCDGFIDTDALPSYPEVLDLYGKMGNAQRLEEKYLEEFLFFREDYLKKHMAGIANHPVHPFWLFAETQFVHDHVGKLIMATAENPEAVRKVGGTWAEDFNQAWQMAEKIVGKNPKTIVLPTFFTRVPVKFAVR